jgi:hypothetical protein
MTRPRLKPPEQRRWPWWDQVRDVLSTIAGLSVLAVEAFRGTYNPVAMGIVAFFFGAAVAGVSTRSILKGNAR